MTYLAALLLCLGGIRCSPEKAVARCATDSECPTDKHCLPLDSQGQTACLSCLSNAHCQQKKKSKYCLQKKNIKENRCVECLKGEHCPSGACADNFCVTECARDFNNHCIPCKESSVCPKYPFVDKKGVHAACRWCDSLQGVCAPKDKALEQCKKYSP